MTKTDPRKNNIQIAQQTLQVIENGHYSFPGGKRVTIAKAQELAEEGSELIRPSDWTAIHAKAITQPRIHSLKITVANETTFAAGQRLRQLGPVLALNFASARNPGGGFLSGAKAQEETLTRGSGLYPTLLKHPEYYDHNRKNSSLLYSDYMIYSPEVPVFRNDAMEFLENSYTLSFITAPAPNRGAIEQNKTGEESKIEAVFKNRIGLLLALAASKGYHRLILGAWGCGAFRNNPTEVAGWFREQLINNPDFKGLFSEVHFAVYDHTPEGRIVQPFRSAFNIQ